MTSMIEEFGKVLKSGETKELGKDLAENVVGALCLDPIAYKNLVQLVIKIPMSLREQFFWNKYYNFLKGVYTPYDKMVAMSSKMFGNDTVGRKNALRVIEIIGKLETEENLQFVINATRSCLLGLIDIADYFRIIKAIEETLCEDLIFLSKNITRHDYFKGNIQILALERSGLMIQAGIDANEDVESQSYVISTLGRMVDQYAISFENEERHNWHNKSKSSEDDFKIELPTASNDEIDDLFKDKKEGET